MARKGIYVNGKEIVARYVGDKLVWKKGVDFQIANISATNIQYNQYSLLCIVMGTFTTLHQAIFYNVKLVINGNVFPYLAETVTLRPNNPIAQIKFANWSEFQEFEIVTRRSSYPTIRMFIEE